MAMPRLRITKLDWDAMAPYQRVNVPKDEDVGKTVIPIFMRSFYVDDKGVPFGILPENPVLRLDQTTYEGSNDDGSYVRWFYSCVTLDGRVIDLVGTEVEPVIEVSPSHRKGR
jgi:hypothetical protein|tara:strand:+ start:1268 stop:1606 length:339 start_codon:yes stop_codon:yes gene_type:complete